MVTLNGEKAKQKSIGATANNTILGLECFQLFFFGRG